MQRIVSTSQADTTTALQEQIQYQLDVFRTMMKLVALACAPLTVFYVYGMSQQSPLATSVIALSFFSVTIIATTSVFKLNKNNLNKLARIFLVIATITVLSFALFQAQGFFIIGTLGATLVLTIAAFLEPTNVSRFWSGLNIAGFLTIALLKNTIKIPETDIGIFHDIVIYLIPLVVLIILTEMNRVTTQHFKINLIKSEKRRIQLEDYSEKLRLIATELARSNRELQDFAYVASHDLQEPLRKVNAFGERLQDILVDVVDEKGLDYLARMLNAAQRMQQLIEDLLAYSRVTTKQEPFEQLDLDPLLKDVLLDLELAIEQKNAKIEADILPKIDADERQIKQLFQNLISNALKYSKVDLAPEIRIRVKDAFPSAEMCQIIIEDNGIGFDQTYSERIFGVFQRLHGRKEYEGSGIGLAICRKIVERHRGTIEAISTPDLGSKFIISLPYQQNNAEETEWQIDDLRLQF